MSVVSPAQAYTQGYNAWKRHGHAASCGFGKLTSQYREWHKGLRTAQDFERANKPQQLELRWG